MRIQALLLLATALLGACGQAQSAPQVRTIFSGRNVYSPTILFDSRSGKYKMWYGGWQSQSDYPHDKIFYRESSDASAWSAPTTVLTHSQIPVTNVHVNDPTVVTQVNAVTKAVQYTMFYTVCVRPCTRNAENQIWSSVSSNGLAWSFHKPLITSQGAAVPSAVVLEAGQGAVWRLYYSNTSERTDAPRHIYAVDVDGNRDVSREPRVVFTYSGAGVIANPEVRQVGGTWHLLFNVYHKPPGASRDTGDIYSVSSKSPTSFSSASARPLIVSDPAKSVCATVAPSLLADRSGLILQYGQATYQPNGKCDFSIFHSLRQVRAETGWLTKGLLMSGEADAE